MKSDNGAMKEFYIIVIWSNFLIGSRKHNRQVAE